MAQEKTTKSKALKFAIAAGMGGIFGFFGAKTILDASEQGALGLLDGSREVALLVALIYVLTALAVLFGLASPRLGAKFLNVEDADELREQRPMLGWSGLGMICWGGILMVLALGGQGMPIPGGVALPLAGCMAGLSVLATRYQWRHTDELLRDVSRDSAALGFYLLLLVGGGWAAVGHLGLGTGPAHLDWLTMASGFTLVAVYWQAGRRGMMTLR